MSMPQYLSPGVYVEEVPSSIKAIAGVSTSTPGFIGVVPNKIHLVAKQEPTAADPSTTKFVDFTVPTPAETAVLITNWTQFTRAFGDLVGDAAAAESADTSPAVDEIGRASCRERGLRSVGAASAIAKNSSPAPSHAACLPDHHQHHA